MNISSLHTDYLNLESISGFVSKSERAHAFQKKCKFCEGVNHPAEKCFKIISKEKKQYRAVDVSSNRQMERTPRKCFRCGSEDHMIAKCPNPPIDNEKRRNQVRFNEKAERACNNGKNNYDHEIYASIARMYSNDERSSENYGDSSLLTNWILHLGATCHMTPEFSDFVPGSLEDTDKYIEVADGHKLTAKQKVKYK